MRYNPLRIALSQMKTSQAGPTPPAVREQNMIRLFLLLIFAGMVALEVTAMLHVGTILGVGWTLAWIFASTLIGIGMLRMAGLTTLIRIHNKLRAEILPTEELIDMGLILVGAFFLILPGFVTDGLGLLVLLSPLRWIFRRFILTSFGRFFPSMTTPENQGMAEEVIEIQREN